MAKVVVGAEVQIKTNGAEGSVKSLKQQLREAQADVATLSEKFGATSQAAMEAAKRAANLKDAIGDAKALTDAFNPDRKFQAFSTALQGVTSGFAAVQGAQALLGVNSENLEKTLLKVQSAMALSQGLNGLLEARDSFKNLGIVASAAFKSIRSAIGSSGIGLLVIAIGAAVTALMEYVDSQNEAEKAAKSLEEQEKELKDAIEKTNKEIQKRNNQIEYNLNLELQNAKARGASIKELRDIEAKYWFEKRYNAQEDLRLSQKKRDELIKDGYVSGKILEDATKDLEEKTLAWNEINQKFNIAEAKLREEDYNHQKDINKKKLDDQNKYNEEAKKLQSELIIKLQDLNQSAEQVEINELTRKYNEQLRILKLGHQSTINAEYLYQDELRKIKDKYRKEEETFNPEDLPEVKADAQRTLILIDNSKQRMKWAQLEYEQKVQFSRDIGNALVALSDLVGQQTAAGKALAVAQSLINTYTGATDVLSAKSLLPEPFRTISKIANVATIVATGLRAVKQIVATRVPGSSGGGASIPSVTAPIAPQIGGTQLNQNQVNQLSSATTRAFVLESDVSGNQERIRRLNRAARIN